MAASGAALARMIHDAHRGHVAFAPIAVDGVPLEESMAYEVQEHLVALLRHASGAATVGYKIGLTSAVMQTMCGIGSPVYGQLLGDRLHQSGAELDLRRYGRLGIEFEIAVRLAHDVTEPPQSWPDLAPLVDAICPAFELIDDRGADYARLDGPSLIADNGWSAGAVFGAWQPAPADLATRGGRVYRNDALADEGRIGDAYGHPFDAVLWIARALAQRGRSLRAGMIVMTGSVVKTRFPVAGERWRYAVDGLGAVDVAFDGA